MFVPPINLGQFQPSPATLADWIYQIWNYLQNNPIATQEQLQEYIANFITTSPETQELIGEGVENYLTENPPQAPVQSVQGKTGAVQLAYNEIVPASNAVPVYKATAIPSTATLTGQYNLGYRIFVNTTTQEIYTISPAGALSLVGRGKFDGTTVDLNSEDGDTTIYEAIDALNFKSSTIDADAFGWVTSSAKNLHIVIPLSKVCDPAKTATITSLTITMRTPTGTYAPSISYVVDLSSEFSSAYFNDNGLHIILSRASGWGTGADNNVPLTGSVVASVTVA